MEARETVINDGLAENIADIAWENAEVPQEHEELSHLYRELAARRAITLAQAETTWSIAYQAGYEQSVLDNDNWCKSSLLKGA